MSINSEGIVVAAAVGKDPEVVTVVENEVEDVIGLGPQYDNMTGKRTRPCKATMITIPMYILKKSFF